MSGSWIISLDQLQSMMQKALFAHGTEINNAHLVARALAFAEADGLPSHGVYRLLSYCAQFAMGKIDGHAVPAARKVADAAVVVNANHGFAYPAISLAIEKQVSLAPKMGIGLAALTCSHHCGVAGHHVEALAREGLIGLMFANTPKATIGGEKGNVWDKPHRFCCTTQTKKPLIIDMSLCKVARGKILVASQQGRIISESWALDDHGKSTTNPESALLGTMIPIGGAKGIALALLVEVLAATLTSSNFGFQASSFFSDEASSPSVGQLIKAIAPNPISNEQFESRPENFIDEILIQGSTSLPGDSR